MANTDNSPKTCKCGCGASVMREFRPGHDAKFKSTLVNAARQGDWRAREAAVETLIERNWSHFVEMEIIASCKVRSIVAGRHVDTLHVVGLVSVVNDEGGFGHSHNFCPSIEGRVVRVAMDQAGFLCSTCIHTQDVSERAGRRAQSAWATAGSAEMAQAL